MRSNILIMKTLNQNITVLCENMLFAKYRVVRQLRICLQTENCMRLASLLISGDVDRALCNKTYASSVYVTSVAQFKYYLSYY